MPSLNLDHVVDSNSLVSFVIVETDMNPLHSSLLCHLGHILGARGESDIWHIQEGLFHLLQCMRHGAKREDLRTSSGELEELAFEMVNDLNCLL